MAASLTWSWERVCAAGEPGTGVVSCSGAGSVLASAASVAGAACADMAARWRLPAVPDLDALRARSLPGDAGVAKTSCAGARGLSNILCRLSVNRLSSKSLTGRSSKRAIANVSNLIAYKMAMQ